ncbi:MAG TPA: DNA gyrase inhibitor YacG [Verrucomicrobiae bacterium]|nr:DNA gyrase inhibitor YacG [Verrucomicrobiae bacterium]
MGEPKTIKCPTCKKAGNWLAGPYGPFCSKRCKLVDLGKWLGEENVISEPLRPDHFQPFENLPDGEDPDRA